MILSKIFSHPLMQLLSFLIILVGSAYFGGPYGFFLYHAMQLGYIYAIIGCIAVVITLASVFMRGKAMDLMQFIGSILMVLSLLVFFFSSQHFINMHAFREIIPFLTLLLFVTVTVLVVRKQLTEKI